MRKRNIRKLLIWTGIITILSSSQVFAKPNGGTPVIMSKTSLIQPYWKEASTVQVYLTSSGNTLSSLLSVSAYSDSTKISGIMYLQKLTGSKWTNVTSWKINGTGDVAVEKSYKGTSGVTYRVKTVVKVGTETITEYSDSSSI